MKAVVQKVTSSKITVEGEEICSIETGLCVFVGFSKKDTEKDVDYMVKKLLALKLFEDKITGKRWQKNVKDSNYEILCVSQFSLYNKLKGNSLEFHQAMQGDEAKEFYYSFLKKLGQNYCEEKIKDGRYGVVRIVHIQNDGPVTITLESPVLDESNKEK
ncbi:D-aminoacyl-tRNA deacylase-like [Episyrphus balteatus]|uniref:D-aminoacyl-tRNA deacylase-like n=1 Tax=Episyrphus balteatus TaxID=286459 RepID=UPI002484DAD3|nr:D-aminoacyl-tRNA deacylase-like [Episyrphus balteatus]